MSENVNKLTHDLDTIHADSVLLETFKLMCEEKKLSKVILLHVWQSLDYNLEIFVFSDSKFDEKEVKTYIEGRIENVKIKIKKSFEKEDAPHGKGFKTLYKAEDVCSNIFCGEKNIKDGDKCIFHCEKRGWYVEDEKGNRDWKKSKQNCFYFCYKFRDLLGKNEENKEITFHNFTDFIFPEMFLSFLCPNSKSIEETSEVKSFKEKSEFKKPFKFDGSKFCGDVDFCFTQDDSTKFLEDVSFNFCCFEGRIFIGDCYFSSLFFIKTSFYDEVSILYTKCSKLFFIKSSFYKNSSLYLKEKEKCTLSLDGAKTINGSVLNIGNGFESFYSQNVRDLNVKFKKVTFEENNRFYFKFVFFDDCTFKENIYIMEDYDDKIKPKRSEIIFSNPTFKENVSVFIENIVVDNFKLKYFTSFAKIFRLTDVCVNSKLSFYHSNLAGVEFNNFDLSSTKKIKLENSFFIGSNGNTIFNGVNWGKNLEYRLENATRDALRRDALRQLKHVYDLQGNYIEANKFYALEMDEYRKEDKSWLQEIVFWIGRYSSNFSQNWVLPILWFILAGELSSLGGFFLKTKANFDCVYSPVFDKFIAPIYALGFLICISLCSKENKKFLYSFCVFLIFMLGICLFKLGDIGFIDFINPFNTDIKKNGSGKIVKFPFILFKLISVFLGYQLVTSLRHYTRRK